MTNSAKSSILIENVKHVRTSKSSTISREHVNRLRKYALKKKNALMENVLFCLMTKKLLIK
jgi:hypothetical protein